MHSGSRAAAGIFHQFKRMLHHIKPCGTCVGPAALRRSPQGRSLLLQQLQADPRVSYTCSTALSAKHEPRLPRHVPRSVAARAPTIKHQWDTETAKQVNHMSDRGCWHQGTLGAGFLMLHRADAPWGFLSLHCSTYNPTPQKLHHTPIILPRPLL